MRASNTTQHQSMAVYGLMWALGLSIPPGIICLVLFGSEGGIGWGLALAIVGSYFIASVIGDGLATRMTNATGMVVLILGFILRAACVAVVLWLIVSNGVLVGESRVDSFVWTTLGLVIGWSLGFVHAQRRTRSYIYDPQATHVEGGSDGDPAQR